MRGGANLEKLFVQADDLLLESLRSRLLGERGFLHRATCPVSVDKSRDPTL